MDFEQSLKQANLVEIDSRTRDGMTLVKVIDAGRLVDGFCGVCTVMPRELSAIPAARALEDKYVSR